MMLSKTFCKVCGVNLTNEMNGDVTDEQKGQWNDGIRQLEAYAKLHNPVNLRVLPDVDLAKLEINMSSLYLEPKYQNP